MYELKVGDLVSFPPTSIKAKVYDVRDGFFRATSEGGGDIVYTQRTHKLAIASGVYQYNKYNVEVRSADNLSISSSA